MDPVVLDHSRYPQVCGELFRAVQSGGLFDDDKTFVDAKPRESPPVIVERFLDQRENDGFDLETFVHRHFAIPAPVEHEGAHPESMEEYIETVWSSLTRTFDADPPDDGTLFSLPNRHVVPGDRFREMYYWDSYFIAEGLAAVDRIDAVADIVDNVASMVDAFGFVPLGNRVYYDSRSQVPLFYRTLHVLERERGFAAVDPYVDRLVDEYEFWMAGRESVLADDEPAAARRVVELPDGTALNRYWDSRAKPRPEAYSHDRELAARVPTDDRPALFRDLRAACESGWDFTTRWLADAEDMTSIRTTDLVPVDLNAVLYEVETGLTDWLARRGEDDRASAFEGAAERRREAVETHLWDEEAGFYVDYDWAGQSRSAELTLAGTVPLFAGLASQERAERVAGVVSTEFLEDGGLVTTLRSSDQQWDRPNGWAPLQWFAVVGLRRYGFDALAEEIADRWLSMVRSVYDQTGTMQEKYDVHVADSGVGLGEYPQQYGFGWTNGVAVALESLDDADVRRVDR
ncbi:MAG: trehalase family glycosidase [Halanaeroarchaeum sp.]